MYSKAAELLVALLFSSLPRRSQPHLNTCVLCCCIGIGCQQESPVWRVALCPWVPVTPASAGCILQQLHEHATCCLVSPGQLDSPDCKQQQTTCEYHAHMSCHVFPRGEPTAFLSGQRSIMHRVMRSAHSTGLSHQAIVIAATCHATV
jgi:hypothetical protein